LDAVVCSNFYNVQCRLSQLTLEQKPSPLHNPKDIKSFFILKGRICGDLALYLHLGVNLVENVVENNLLLLLQQQQQPTTTMEPMKMMK
jgi:hypothetical protein